MDSKNAVPAYTEGDAGPPSYDDTISSHHTTAASPTSQYYSSQIQSQLKTLNAQIASIQTQRDILSHVQEEKILSLLAHHIHLYISDFANTGLRKGSLILVPAKAIQDPKAIPTDYDFSEPSEYDRVVKVTDKEIDRYGATQDLWYWEDENMAMRLAGYLRPSLPDPRTVDLPKRQEQVPLPTQFKSWGFFGKKKREERPPLIEERKDESSQPKAGVTSLGREGEDRVVVDIKAEEVVFRTENEFGMYGTEKGWGIVVKLRVVVELM
ncbi:hypothetical protein WAI453_009734 [Rhynchosporium graminicola]|uniref:Uncharacterized protein n=1 Tax=Rhynchosporium graminicola TaxID=2792576 RepID=A0A1E1KDD9_9HELO|nr:uncharacterized protein RCO7_05068 [Rhynchosporium commune]